MKPPSGPLLPACVLAVALLGGCAPERQDGPAVAMPETAQAEVPGILEPGQAQLVRGSESVRGLPGFGRNAIPALSGAYVYPGTDGAPLTLEVWFTREPLVMDTGWQALSCTGLRAGYALRQNSSASDGARIVVASGPDHALVLRLPADFELTCRFTAALIDRFVFFMRNAGREEDISFPAFLRF